MYLSPKEVTARYGIDRSTLWRWQKRKGFPQPIKLSTLTIRWKLDELEAWERISR